MAMTGRRIVMNVGHGHDWSQNCNECNAVICDWLQCSQALSQFEHRQASSQTIFGEGDTLNEQICGNCTTATADLVTRGIVVDPNLDATGMLCPGWRA